MPSPVKLYYYSVYQLNDIPVQEAFHHQLQSSTETLYFHYFGWKSDDDDDDDDDDGDVGGGCINIIMKAVKLGPCPEIPYCPSLLLL